MLTTSHALKSSQRHVLGVLDSILSHEEYSKCRNSRALLGWIDVKT